MRAPSLLVLITWLLLIHTGSATAAARTRTRTPMPSLSVHHAPPRPQTAARQAATGGPFRRSVPGTSHFASHFPAHAASTGGSAGLGNNLGRRTARPATLGGPAAYDAKKGAVIGGRSLAALPRKLH